MTALPSSLKVGGIDYILVEMDDLVSAKGEDCLGLTDFDKAIILIERKLAEPVKWQVFLHELVHVAIVHLGYDHIPENMIDGIAYFLLALLENNRYLSIDEAFSPTWEELLGEA